MSPEATLTQLAAHGEQIKSLQEWREVHEACMVRIEQKIDWLTRWMMGALLAGLLALVAAFAQLMSAPHQPSPGRADDHMVTTPAPARASATVGAAKAAPAAGFFRSSEPKIPLKP